MYSNVAAFAFHAEVSRNLGVIAYGSLYALLSFVQLASLPANTFMMVVAKFAAEFRAVRDAAHLSALSRVVVKGFSLMLLFYVIAGLAFAGPIAAFMRVPSWTVVAAAATAGAQIFVFALRAIPQGTQEFRTFSLSFVIDATAKVLFGALLTIAGFGLGGGLVGFCSGFVIAAAYVAWNLWKTYSSEPPTQFLIDWRRVFVVTSSAFALTMSTTILSYGDVLIVKHFFSSQDAGIYAAASLGGKILLFLLLFGPMVLVPKAADRASRGVNSAGPLVGVVIISLVLSVAGLLCFTFGGAFVLRLLVGNQFSAAVPLLVPYGAAMAVLGMTSVIGAYALALHRNAFAWPLVLVALAEMVTMVLYHPSLLAILSVLLAANGVALAVVSVALAVETLFWKRAEVNP